MVAPVRSYYPPLLVALTIVLCGCGAATSGSDYTTVPGDKGGPVKPSPTTQPSKSAATPGEEPKAKIAAGQESPETGNPNRVYQLKDLKKIDLPISGQTVHAWIMDNEGKRAEGMMFLTTQDVKENEGMIFVFPAVQPVKDHSFWMHNCPLGLDIIYIGKKKQVLNVGDGPPESDAMVPASGDYDYVLEMKRGWSKRHGLKAGDGLKIPDSLKTSE